MSEENVANFVAITGAPADQAAAGASRGRVPSSSCLSSSGFAVPSRRRACGAPGFRASFVLSATASADSAEPLAPEAATEKKHVKTWLE